MYLTRSLILNEPGWTSSIWHLIKSQPRILEPSLRTTLTGLAPPIEVLPLIIQVRLPSTSLTCGPLPGCPFGPEIMGLTQVSIAIDHLDSSQQLAGCSLA